jgi:hypothetical protein
MRGYLMRFCEKGLAPETHGAGGCGVRGSLLPFPKRLAAGRTPEAVGRSAPATTCEAKERAVFTSKLNRLVRVASPRGVRGGLGVDRAYR